jgi:DNA polymerase elongation subunit (family B)
MNKLVFDIETAGEQFEKMDEVSQELLETRFRKRAKDDKEFSEAKESLSFFAETAQIVAIGMLNPDTQKGAVYYQGPESQPLSGKEIGYIPCSSEKQVIKNFWENCMNYDEYITFNGRTFDIPVLMIRSAINGIRPTRNLMLNRYLGSQQYVNYRHVDLFDQLSFDGARYGNTLGLHFWARAFGIASPKEGELTGDKVTEYFRQGQGLDIAKYCMNDVIATAALYEKWNKYLRFL